MKRIYAVLMCMILAAASLVGCAQSSGDSKADSSVQESSKEESSAAEESSAVEEFSEAESSAEESKAEENTELKAELRAKFLEKADQVVVEADSVTFEDASSETVTIQKNPQKTVNLYGSFTTLWYEAGGTVAGCIGGDSAITLYQEYIGRDITQDEGVTVVATSSSGKKWDVESIIAQQPDLIICSTAMSGYSTIQAPAEAAGIPVIAMSYNDFSDYLKWFKVFCNLNGQPELWDTVAMPALDKVVDVLCRIPVDQENPPKVFAMFSAAKDNITANTSNTVLGGMISEMGAINISDADADSDADRIEINLESVYAADPDLIVVQCHASTDDDAAQLEGVYGDNPVWQSLRAVQDGKIYFLEPHLFHYKPNSHFAEAYKTLAEIIYPDIDFGE